MSMARTSVRDHTCDRAIASTRTGASASFAPRAMPGTTDELTAPHPTTAKSALAAKSLTMPAMSAIGRPANSQLNCDARCESYRLQRICKFLAESQRVPQRRRESLRKRAIAVLLVLILGVPSPPYRSVVMLAILDFIATHTGIVSLTV